MATFYDESEESLSPNLNQLADSSPVQNVDEKSSIHTSPGNGRVSVVDTLGTGGSRQSKRLSLQRTASTASQKALRSADNPTYDVPEEYANLFELTSILPVENPNEDHLYRHAPLEEARSREQEHAKHEQARRASIARGEQPNEEENKGDIKKGSRVLTELYTISYLILFALLGTLARLGLQALTFYPGAPVVFSELWANFGGSLIFGFLAEDRMLFKEEWGTPNYHQAILKAKARQPDEERSSSEQAIDLATAKKAHAATKKTIPLYIGLATGFCGSFTSFSSFIRDAYLAMANGLPTPLNHPADYIVATTSTSTVHRSGGYSFMAVLAVIITHVALSVSALQVGAQLANLLELLTPSLPYRFVRKILDPLCVIIAWGCWVGATILAIFPPDRSTSGTEIWRGRAVFALVFAPVGCLGRFYASLYLNNNIASFPLGTFVVNIFGTLVLGMSWDLQRMPLGGVIGCQVLQGIQDGFCGCLTTVSTWVGELTSLRRRNAWRYGVMSVVVAFCSLVVIMGSMQWTRGFHPLLCVH